MMDQAQQGVQGGYRLGIAELNRSDPHADTILDRAYNVAIFTCSPEMNDWSETCTQATLLVYNRSFESGHALFTIDLASRTHEVTTLTPQKEFHFEAPSLFCKDLGRVRCFRFETEDDFNRISKLIRRLMQSIRFRSQDMPRYNYTDVLSMLADSQGVSDHSTEQSNQANEAMPSPARTTPSNVWTILDDENEPMRHARIEVNETVRSCESVTPEPPVNFDLPNPAMWNQSVLNTMFPLPSRTTATSPYVIDAVNAAMKPMKHTPNQVNETLPYRSSTFSSSNPAARQGHRPISSLSRTRPTSSNVLSISEFEYAEKKRSLNPDNKPTPSPAPARTFPPSSYIFCDTNTRTRQVNKAVPSSKAMSTTDAVNAAMAHDLYQVDKSSPSYSIITPESKSVMSMSTGADASKKRTLPAQLRVDQIEKRQKIAASFQCSQTSSDTVSQASSSSHHLPPQLMSSTSTRRAEEAEASAWESQLNATIRPKPKLYSPLMFMDRKPLPNETDISTPTEATGVIRLNKTERYGSLKAHMHDPINPSPLVSMERKQSTKETFNATVRTGTEQLSSGVFRVNSSERNGNGSPEPLTQNQLLQAISHLIRTDAGFMHKLHQAYLQSFREMLSKTN